MKKLLFTIGVATVLTACSTANYVTHEVSETPTLKREAIIYDDHVVIVTRTKLSLEQYHRAIANTENNRQNKED